MFWRKRKIKLFEENNGVDKNVQVPVYAPTFAYRPKDYYIPIVLTELEETFEERCMTFLHNAHPDQYNGSYMDGLIEKIGEESLSQLEYQKTDHIDTLEYLLNQIWSGDKIKGKSKLEQAEKEIAILEKEIAKLETIYWRKTSYSEED